MSNNKFSLIKPLMALISKSIRAKLILCFTLAFCIFSFVFTASIYFSAKYFLQDNVEKSTSSTLYSVKAIVETAINIAVSNYLKPVVQKNDLYVRSQISHQSEKHKDVKNINLGSYPVFINTNMAEQIESYVVDIDGHVLTSTIKHSVDDNLWSKRDANGLYYFQHLASIARALPHGETGFSHYWQDGQFIIAVFSFIKEMDLIVVTTSPRNALDFFTNTDAIRDELVALKIGNNGSIEIFDEVGLQYVHSAKQFEGNIRISNTHLKIKQLKEGRFISQERLADVGSQGYFTTSAKIKNDKLITKHYEFTLAEQIKNFNQQIESGSLKKSELSHFLSLSSDSCNILHSTLYNAGKLVKSFKVVMLDQSRNEIRDISLKAYILDIYTSLKHEHKRYNLEFVVNCPDNINLHCDPAHLYQIFNNLILNSLRHAFNLEETNEIQINVDTTETNLMITFQDNGSGISDEILPNIFKPFFTTKRELGGSGIGLHVVVSNIVENVFKGTIQCESNAGARFIISMPCEGLVLSERII